MTSRSWWGCHGGIWVSRDGPPSPSSLSLKDDVVLRVANRSDLPHDNGHNIFLPQSPSTMSYGKKDEDADLGMVKVDRTQVFQEGKLTVRSHDTAPFPPAMAMGIRELQLISRIQHDFSTAHLFSREDVESS